MALEKVEFDTDTSIWYTTEQQFLLFLYFTMALTVPTLRIYARPQAQSPKKAKKEMKQSLEKHTMVGTKQRELRKVLSLGSRRRLRLGLLQK